MKIPEYMKMKLTKLLEDFAALYNLSTLINANGFVSIRIQKGMYGLPQAGLLANKLLEKRLNKYGYLQSKLVPGL